MKTLAKPDVLENCQRHQASSSATCSAQCPEWMDTPEKRRRIWAWQAAAGAMTGDEQYMNECVERALEEDRQCKNPIAPNSDYTHAD